MIYNLGRIGFVFEGDWDSNKTYKKLSVVTYDGGLWCAQNLTVEEPYEGSTDWILMLQAGGSGGGSGPATTATKLATPRDISVSGLVTSTPQAFDGTKNLVIPVTGVQKADKLTTSRSLKVDLESTATVSFDGSADLVNIPISGVLAVANGGTGSTSASAAKTNLNIPSVTKTTNTTLGTEVTGPKIVIATTESNASTISTATTDAIVFYPA